ETISLGYGSHGLTSFDGTAKTFRKELKYEKKQPNINYRELKSKKMTVRNSDGKELDVSFLNILHGKFVGIPDDKVIIDEISVNIIYNYWTKLDQQGGFYGAFFYEETSVLGRPIIEVKVTAHETMSISKNKKIVDNFINTSMISLNKDVLIDSDVGWKDGFATKALEKSDEVDNTTKMNNFFLSNLNNLKEQAKTSNKFIRNIDANYEIFNIVNNDSKFQYQVTIYFELFDETNQRWQKFKYIWKNKNLITLRHNSNYVNNRLFENRLELNGSYIVEYSDNLENAEASKVNNKQTTSTTTTNNNSGNALLLRPPNNAYLLPQLDRFREETNTNSLYSKWWLNNNKFSDSQYDSNGKFKGDYNPDWDLKLKYGPFILDPNLWGTKTPVKVTSLTTPTVTSSTNNSNQQWNPNLENISFKMVEDKGKLIKAPNLSDPANKDGGTWEYYSDVNVRFTTTQTENEILEINGNKIDVIDNVFSIRLSDTRKIELNEKKEEVQTGTNEYKIVLKQFKKDNNNNIALIQTYTKTIVIKGKNDVFEAKWYAWNPENNKQQKLLIEKYLKDDDGNELLNEKGEKVLNPAYDEDINPKTGTKKQLIWVKNRRITSLKTLQDPLDQNNNSLIRRNGNFYIKDYGFIAEAAILGKGANLSAAGIEKLNRYDVFYSENYDPVKQDEWKPYKINNEDSYFSKSGMYLFVAKANYGIDSIKMVAIGEDFDNKQKFLDQFVDSGRYGWLNFWDSQAGKHLALWFKNKEIEENVYLKYSYEELLYFWKQYVESIARASITNADAETIRIEFDQDKVKKYFNDKSRTDTFNITNDFILENKWFKSQVENKLKLPIDKTKIELSAKVDTENSMITFDYRILSIPVNLYSVEVINQEFAIAFKGDKPIDNTGKDIVFSGFKVKEAEVDPNEIYKVNFNYEYAKIIIEQITREQFQERSSSLFAKEWLYKVVNTLDPNKTANVVFDTMLFNDKIEFNFRPVKKGQTLLKDYAKFFVKADFKPGLKIWDGSWKPFYDGSIADLNLNGLTKVEDIKKKILEYAKENLPSEYVYLKDYKIDISDQVLNKLKTVYTKDANAFYNAAIVIRPLGIYYGGNSFIVYNKIGGTNTNNVDLSSEADKAKLRTEYSYKTNNLDELKSLFISDLNKELAKMKLTFADVTIPSFNYWFTYLVSKVGNNSATLTIKGNSNLIEKNFVVTVNNAVTKVAEGLKLDISDIEVEPLEMQLTAKDEITKVINDRLNKIVLDYKLELKNLKFSAWRHYSWLRALVAKNPPEWKISTFISISGINDYQGSFNQIVINKSGTTPFDPDDTTPGKGGWTKPEGEDSDDTDDDSGAPTTPNNATNDSTNSTNADGSNSSIDEAAAEQGRNILLGVGVTVGIVTFAVLGFLAYGLYLRKRSKNI
ncbi:Mbov_0399 family ICE element protein, partial [Mycoplasmopsis agassizii]